jgi:hypothetical protein
MGHQTGLLRWTAVRRQPVDVEVNGRNRTKCPGSCHALDPGRKGLAQPVQNYLSICESVLTSASAIVVIASEIIRSRRSRDEDQDGGQDN